MEKANVGARSSTGEVPGGGGGVGRWHGDIILARGEEAQHRERGPKIALDMEI